MKKNKQMIDLIMYILKRAKEENRDDIIFLIIDSAKKLGIELEQ